MKRVFVDTVERIRVEDESSAIAVRLTSDCEGIDMPRKPSPELMDDEAPEAGAEWFAKALPAKDVLPGLLGDAAAKEMLKPRRGRPPAVPASH